MLQNISHPAALMSSESHTSFICLSPISLQLRSISEVSTSSWLLCTWTQALVLLGPMPQSFTTLAHGSDNLHNLGQSLETGMCPLRTLRIASGSLWSEDMLSNLQTWKSHAPLAKEPCLISVWSRHHSCHSLPHALAAWTHHGALMWGSSSISMETQRLSW